MAYNLGLNSDAPKLCATLENNAKQSDMADQLKVPTLQHILTTLLIGRRAVVIKADMCSKTKRCSTSTNQLR